MHRCAAHLVGGDMVVQFLRTQWTEGNSTVSCCKMAKRRLKCWDAASEGLRYQGIRGKKHLHLEHEGGQGPGTAEECRTEHVRMCILSMPKVILS